MNPYRVPEPACISFSGGRTSGFMLWSVLQAYGGALPAGVHVIFANTGKEREETLVFVEECSVRWGVPIVWLEYDGRRAQGAGRRVSFATASRDGEPFSQLLADKRALPDWQARWCTSELKVKRIRGYMASLGYESWTDVVGLRSDEPRRVARRKADTTDGRVAYSMPLDVAGVTQADVLAFWRAQPFDLSLAPGEGNCDLCFMKGVKILRPLMKARPESVEWWATAELALGHSFSKRYTYDGLLAQALLPPERLTRRQRALEEEPDDLACGCTD